MKGYNFFFDELLPSFERSEEIYLERDYYAPSFYCLLASSLYSKNYIERYFSFHPEMEWYLKVINFNYTVFSQGKADTIARPNAAINYSPLVRLASANDVDNATSTINSCIRHFAGNNPNMSLLYKVVGELHDNVCSHGLKTGFSLAQKTKIPNQNDYYFEFSVADSGLGFLHELKRARIKGIENDVDAIEWCVMEGHSTKLPPEDFVQSLREDFLGSVPSSHLVQTRDDGSNHQGLGLFHLISLVDKFNGELLVASGFGRLTVKDGVRRTFIDTSYWQGVAISVKLKESELQMQAKREIDDELAEVMRALES